PDTMYFGVTSDSLLRSIDRGKTWSKWGQTLFRGPWDIVVVPESDSALIIVSDGVKDTWPGNYWRTTGGSGLFTDQLTIPSEIPRVACSRLRNTVAFGTNWAGGGVRRSEDSGLTWPSVHDIVYAWGVDIARDDPDCVVFGTSDFRSSNTTAFISFSGGW